MLKLEDVEKVIREKSHIVENVEEVKQIVKAAAKAGICPECGTKLILENYRWHLFGPKGRDAVVICPNDHNLNYNERTGTEAESCGYCDMNLHRIGNGLWDYTQNQEIRKVAYKIWSWLSD
jgi:ssDNA-binding Zn-finger/Zn-ribbon topoisomerase 1